MPTTRSASKKQTSLEDYTEDKNSTSRSSAKQESRNGQHKTDSRSGHSIPSKRKLHVKESGREPKKPKKSQSDSNTSESQTQSQLGDSNITTLEKPIIINRSPVLQLWAAAVSSFLHPEESWSTCLSIGGSISTLCAISKGRAVGKVAPKDSSTEKKGKKEVSTNARELEVMGFTLQVKDGVVVIEEKPKPVKEGLLQGKFGGEEEYLRVRGVMEEALRTWSDDKEQLDHKAFHMYEKFRPNVASGSSGWGRIGELNLHKVRSTIESKG